ncbi:SUMO1 sentrin specific peptidase 8 [Coemansia sp. RSA 2610]|nr:SUMO1 sentrin specific peptidase 8 [Coemansia sp. RSA 2610]
MRETLLFAYHGVAVYSSDIKSLREGHWLNDTILGFYFEYLTHDILRGDSSIVLLKPAVVQLLQQQTDLNSVLQALPPDLYKHEIIFMPIGNGTHWSLLVYCRQAYPAPFHYFDSMANANFKHALAAKLKLEQILFGSQQLPMVTHSCPQQENSYDCGVFVVLFADLLVRRYADLRLPPKMPAQVDIPRAVAVSYPAPGTIQRPMSPFAQAAGDGPGFDIFQPTALRAPVIDRTFWWIDYGDLFNPNTARTMLQQLVNQMQS